MSHIGNANPFGSVQFGARSPAQSGPVFTGRQDAALPQVPSVKGLAPLHGGVTNTGTVPDPVQMLANAIGVPGLASYLSGGKKVSMNTGNPFSVENENGFDIYEANGEAIDPETGEGIGGNTRKRRVPSFQPRLENPFERAFNLIG